MRFRRPAAFGFPLIFVCLLAVPAAAGSLVDRVKDGPAADVIRESLRCLEEGERAADDAAKLEWYARGRQLAEQAIARDGRSADARFALFGNWGRWLQTDGWLKNAYHLPALWRELDLVLELDPDHSDALAAKGGLYRQLPLFLGGDGATAEPLLRRAVELDPEAVGSRLELAECYLARSHVDEARELARRALRLAEEQGKQRFVVRASKLLSELGESVKQARVGAR